MSFAEWNLLREEKRCHPFKTSPQKTSFSINFKSGFLGRLPTLVSLHSHHSYLVSGTSPYQNFVKNPEVQDMGLSASSAVGGIAPPMINSAAKLADSMSKFFVIVVVAVVGNVLTALVWSDWTRSVLNEAVDMTVLSHINQPHEWTLCLGLKKTSNWKKAVRSDF